MCVYVCACVRKTAQQRPFGKCPKQLRLSCRQKRPEAVKKKRAVVSTLGMEMGLEAPDQRDQRE